MFCVMVEVGRAERTVGRRGGVPAGMVHHVPRGDLVMQKSKPEVLADVRQGNRPELTPEALGNPRDRGILSWSSL